MSDTLRRMNLNPQCRPVATITTFSLTTLVAWILTITPAVAQLPLEADNTLGDESSEINPVPGYPGFFFVDGGAERDTNLFHSFREFNVNEGEGVYFTNPDGIENILSRVTGSNPSQVLGYLGVLGDANLFLLNPNGIIFGPSASLDLRGSFLATTAESFVFPDGSTFSATSPQDTSLLSINVPIGLQYGATSGMISSSARLVVDSGRSLVLAGGEITLDGSYLAFNYPEGGRIELGAAGGAGTVGLLVDGANLALSFPEGLVRADVELSNNSQLDAEVDTSGGDIAIYSHNLDILEGSRLSASIRSGGGSETTQTGDILLNSTGTITLSASSLIENQVSTEATGNAGDIIIQTGSLSVLDGAQISTSTLGNGNAGNILITASDRVTFDFGDAFSEVQTNASGNGGNVEITTGTLDVLNGSFLSSRTFGNGDAGSVRITARDRVTFFGSSEDGRFDSSARTTVGSDATGNAGDIIIEAGSLWVSDLAELNSTTFGTGNAGNILITASDRVTFDFGDAFSEVQTNASGNGGNVEITTGTLDVLNGSFLSSRTVGNGDAGSVRITARDRVTFFGSSEDGRFDSSARTTVGSDATGNAGDITITAGSLWVSEDAELSSSTFGAGNAGNIRIATSNRVTFNYGDAFSQVNEGASGSGGNVEISTGILEVLNGAWLEASTDGNGDAGSIIINAGDRVTFSGYMTDGESTYYSAAYTTVDSNAIGNAGNIEITTDLLTVDEGADLSSSTAGRGNAGDIRITTDRVTFNILADASSQVYAGAIGDGGNIDISTRILNVFNGAWLTTSTFGTGDAGTIRITASDRVTFDGGFASSMVGFGAIGNGDNITIQTGVLNVLNGAQLGADTSGQGDAGNILITASDRVIFAGTSADGQGRSAALTQVEDGATGSGGDIRINTGSLYLLGGAGLSATTSGNGNAGNITLRVREGVHLAGISSIGNTSGIFSGSDDTATGQGGEISITTGRLELGDAATINAGTESNQRGGNIAITADRLVARSGGQIITSTDGAGAAGTIRLTILDELLLEGVDTTLVQRQERFGRGVIENEVIDRTAPSGLFAITRSDATGNGGNIIVDPTVMILRDGARIAVDSRGSGDGGNIQLQAGILTLDRSTISATSRGTGVGGDIRARVETLTLDNGARITTETNSTNGGNITLAVNGVLLLRHGSLISTEAGEASGGGNGGDIDIKAGFIVAVPGENSDIVANAFAGRGGSINITTQAIYGLEYRPERTSLSDITASSEFGVDGTVAINTPGVDPTQGLTALPGNVVDASDQIGQVCPTGPEAEEHLGSFFITGRGGIAPGPMEVLGNEAVDAEWVEGELSEDGDDEEDGGEEEVQGVTEAQGWVVDADGRVQLVTRTQGSPVLSGTEGPFVCP